MKKSLLMVFLVIIFFAMVYPGTLKVDSPNSFERLEKGSTYNITWTGRDLTNPVKITLWKSGTRVGLIIKDQPASGSYRWTVGSFRGGNAATGNGYFIKVKEQRTNVSDMSDNNFTISSPPYIRLDKPNGGENWRDGSTHTVGWYRQGVTGNVVVELIKVFLNRPSIPTAKVIYTGNVNIGSFNWKINENIKTDFKSKIKKQHTYRLRITSVNNSSITDMSNGNFKIMPKMIVMPPPSIEIFRPSSTTVWNMFNMNPTNFNYSYTIMWEKKGGFYPDTTVRIILKGVSGSVRNFSSLLTQNAPNSGIFRDKFPRGRYKLGEYKIIIRAIRQNKTITTAESKVFKIANKLPGS